MGDAYWRYGGGGGGGASGRPSSSERGHMPSGTFPGYLPPETSTQANYNSYSSIDPRTVSSDFSHKDVLPSRRIGAYGVDDLPSVRAEPNTSGLAGGASYKDYPSFEDPNLLAHPRDAASGRATAIPDVGYDRPNSMTRSDGNPVPGYLPHERSALASYNTYSSIDPLTSSSDLLHKDILPSRRTGAYGINDIPSARAEPSISGLVAGASYKAYPSSLEDPNLLAHPRDVNSGRIPGIPDVGYDRPNSMTRTDGNPVPVADSNILFVDGLPTDCTRREIGHLFRPFIGFREIRLIHKERRRRGDKATVLCFIEFTDAKCALTAMEALQGYKFDYKKPNSPSLRIHFAHFPFRLPSDHGEPQFGSR